MKFILWGVISTVALFFFSITGINLYVRHRLIELHGKTSGIALWRQWRI